MRCTVTILLGVLALGVCAAVRLGNANLRPESPSQSLAGPSRRVPASGRGLQEGCASEWSQHPPLRLLVVAVGWRDRSGKPVFAAGADDATLKGLMCLCVRG